MTGRTAACAGYERIVPLVDERRGGRRRSTKAAGVNTRCQAPGIHSHSIVAGGFDEMSSATRFTPGISLMIRLEIRSSTS